MVRQALTDAAACTMRPPAQGCTILCHDLSCFGCSTTRQASVSL